MKINIKIICIFMMIIMLLFCTVQDVYAKRYKATKAQNAKETKSKDKNKKDTKSKDKNKKDKKSNDKNKKEVKQIKSNKSAKIADAREINFSEIKSLKKMYKNYLLYADHGKDINTYNMAQLAILLENCREKGIKTDISEDCISFVADMYKGQGRFCKSDSSDEDADSITSAYSFLALAKKRATANGELKDKIDKIIDDIVKTKIIPLTSNYSKNEHLEKDGVNSPTWLVEGRGDTSSLYILALCEMYKKDKSEETKNYIKMLSDGVKQFTTLKYDEFPYCAHYESVANPHIFTLSANRQTEALAKAGELLKDKELTTSAKNEADNLIVHLLSSYGPICGMAPSPVVYPQTSQGAQVITENLIALAEATNDKKYETLAGISASWFYKGNTAGKNKKKTKTGKSKVFLAGNGVSDDTNLESAIEALSTLVSIYKTEGWDYRLYKELKKPHSYIILQAEEGKAVRKDYEIEDIGYPSGMMGSLVAIRKENSFWLRFSIEEDDEYAFHLCYLKQSGFGVSTSILMRIDGDKIYTVPLAGSQEDTFMFMQEVLERRILQAGLHSMGIKFSGLLLGKAAKIDSVILQPLSQRRTFENEEGEKLTIVKSFHTDNKKYALSNLSKDNYNLEDCTYTSSAGISNAKINNSSEVLLPAYGYLIFEGK